MDFQYPADVEEFRAEFRRYLDSIATSELMEELRVGGRWGGEHTKRLWRKLGEDGYFGIGWPKEYGGGGKSLLYLHAFNYEMAYRRLPVPVVTLEALMTLVCSHLVMWTVRLRPDRENSTSRFRSRRVGASRRSAVDKSRGRLGQSRRRGTFSSTLASRAARSSVEVPLHWVRSSIQMRTAWPTLEASMASS